MTKRVERRRAMSDDERLETVKTVVADLPEELQSVAVFGLLLLWRLVEAQEIIANREVVPTSIDTGVDPEEDGPWMR